MSHHNFNTHARLVQVSESAVRARQEEEQVYLLHFDTPLGSEKHQASHYLGYSSQLEERIRAHRLGKSQAKIMQALHRANISFQVVRIWQGGRDLERALKSNKNHSRFCPLCKQEKIIKSLGFPSMLPTPFSSLFADESTLGQVREL